MGSRIAGRQLSGRAKKAMVDNRASPGTGEGKKRGSVTVAGGGYGGGD